MWPSDAIWIMIKVYPGLDNGLLLDGTITWTSVG